MKIVISIIALLLTLTAVAQEPDEIPGRLVVNFKKELKHFSSRGDLPKFDVPQLDEMGKRYGCYRIHTLKHTKDGYGGTYLLYFPDSVSIPALIRAYEGTGLFRAVDPDYIPLIEILPVFRSTGTNAVYINADVTGVVTKAIYLCEPFIRQLLKRLCLRC